MSEYFDNISVCDRQGLGNINLLANDDFIDDDSSAILFSPNSTPFTNGSLHNPSAVNGEWDYSFDSDFQPNVRTNLRNSGDGSDIPLLLNNDGFNNIVIRPEVVDHCHATPPIPTSSPAVRQLLSAMAMCLIFMIAEVIGGYLAGSLAVMTDAAHLTSDFVGFLVSLFAIWMGKRPPNKRMTFGYHRAEVLGALFSIVIIWILTAVFICLAVQRIIHHDFHIEANTMMVVAAIGIIINIIMGLVLHGACGMSHNHGHSHTSTNHSPAPTREKNINVRAAVIHVLGDLIQSIGVLISAIIIKFYPDAELMDPGCTLVFSLLALITTIPILKDSVLVLMEAFPRTHDYAALARSLRKIEGVRTIHNLHVWCLTINTNALAVHLAIDAGVDPEVVLSQALQLIRRKFDIYNATIQVEKYSADSMLNCAQCKPPND